MKSVLFFFVSLGSGIALAFVGVGLRFGLREATRSVAASWFNALLGFALVVAVLFLPALVGLRRLRGFVSPRLGAVTCFALSSVPIALVNVFIGNHKWDLVNYENAFLVMLVGLPGALFGWLWADNSLKKHWRAAGTRPP